MKTIVVAHKIDHKIHVIRGERVMLAHDLASLYGVPTKRINEQVRRNRKRFPSDFMFPLIDEEVFALRSQFATSSWGGSRYLPIAFTEQGVAMLSSVLNSQRAIDVNIAIMRAFVRMRTAATRSRKLSTALQKLERKVGIHDIHIRTIFETIYGLMRRPDSRRISIKFGSKSGG